MLRRWALAENPSLNRMQGSDVPFGRSRGTRYRWGTCSTCRQAVRAGDIANLPPNVEPSRATRGSQWTRGTSRRRPAAQGYASPNGRATVPLLVHSLDEMNCNAVTRIFGDSRTQLGLDWQLVRSIPKGHE